MKMLNLLGQFAPFLVEKYGTYKHITILSLEIIAISLYKLALLYAKTEFEKIKPINQ